MQSDIIVESVYGRTRLAVVEDGRLRELYSEQAGSEKLVGNIYMGRVENVLPGMQAAFVNIGLEKNAFLYAGDLAPGPDCRFEDSELRAAQIPIQKLVRPGQEIMVQVIKEPGGAKGPRISTHVTLPGRTVVLLPTVEYVGVSRRIPEDKREELRGRMLEIKPEGMGAIVRTAGAGASDDEFRADLEQLLGAWEDICRRARFVSAPRLLHADDTLVLRAVRDMLCAPGARMLIEDERCYRAALGAARDFAPALAGRIERYEGRRPLFELYDVDAQAEKALGRRVWLKSGGYLVIDHAEAMTVIDVNTGKFVGGKGLQDTVLKVNLEAAQEIANQLRLRDVGGIIVIDFIDMDAAESRALVIQTLKDALRSDRTKTNVVGLTGLGMLEMTRRKVYHSLRGQLTQSCRRCGGEGWEYTPDAQARRALMAVRSRDADAETPLLIRAPGAVVRALAAIGAARTAPIYALADESVRDFALEPAPRDLPAGAIRLEPYREDER